MVTLPSIESYSKEQLEDISRYSPVCVQYLQFLQRPPSCFADEIRLFKHQHWLKCAFATYFNLHSPEEVCQYWTQATNEILIKTWREVGLCDENISLLCFGKLGSNELNLSSDIDVVFVRENSFENPATQTKIKNYIKLLNDHTRFGFAYRVDLDLRPGGNQSPLIQSKTHFYNYYDEYLEAWHRLSFVRMRPLLNHAKLSADIVSYCQKRCFPKRLDFSVIQEIKSVRSKIAFQWRKAQEPLDIKLHPGGIRDIELLVHSMQVIYGGRHPQLQVSGMSDAIKGLRSVKAIDEQDSKFLLDFYWQLRKIENLIHIREDQHTYLLSQPALSILQRYNLDEERLFENFQRAELIITDFFKVQTGKEPPPINMGQFDTASQKAIEQIRNLKSTSIKKQGIESLKEEILAHFIKETDKIAIDQELAIQIFRDFIFAIKSKTSIFHLLGRHKELLNDLAWLFSISPYVGQILCRRPELIDSFALRQVAIDENADIEALWESLIDYKLLGQLMAIIRLFKKKDSSFYFEPLSKQADFVVQKLLAYLIREYRSAPLEVLTLGKWSGFELGVRSDLDFVFLSDTEPSLEQIKVARRMITLLTSRSNAGRLYDIDLRLKPNENAGPLILHTEAFFHFIENDAEPWQKQAYLRSRLLGTENFYLRDRYDLLKLNPEEIGELTQIHNRLLTRSTKDQIDLKHDRGGLIDTEFTIQKMILSRDLAPEETSTLHLVQSLDISPETKLQISSNYAYLRRFEQVFQICNDSSSTKVSVKSSNLNRVGKMLQSTQVFKHLSDVISHQRLILKKLDLNH